MSAREGSAGSAETTPAKTVVITGASAGVGRATVRRFAADGVRLGLLAREGEGLQTARKEVAAAGGEAIAVPTDVAEAEAVEAAAQQVEDELGAIDIWINDAMTTVFAPVRRTEAAEFKRATEVTYLGAVYGTMAALRRMHPRDRGKIVQVGSALAYRAIPLQAAYCGAKHAIRGFTDSLRTELMHEHSGISITMVHLPGLNTPQFRMCRAKLAYHPQPMAPIYQPEVAAEAIYHAAHGTRREVYVRWATLATIVGNKIAPGVADRYLARNAVAGQQTDERLAADRCGNLFEPVAGDHGAHGAFDDKARE